MAMNLPEELIVKILLRLPVKSLVRFRCVSKSWHSLISDPQFAKSHFELASQHTRRLIYIAASDARSIDYEAPLHDDSAVANLKFPLDPPAYFVQIMGSCGGFLLLKNDSNLFLWNPSAGFLRPITLSYSCDISSNVNMVPTLYGFGFDPLTDDFLVVLGSYDPSAAGLVTHFEYLSLKTNSWTKIVGIELPYVNPIDEPGAGVLLNGAIHWLAFRLDEWVGVILAFDLVEKNLREVHMPGEIHFVFCDLGVLGGSLSLSYMGVDSVEIWLMKQYRVRSSWTKSIVLSVTDILTNTFSPICFTKGGEIVGFDGCTGLVKYNQKGELLEQRDYSPDWPEGKVAIYTETLLSLPTSTHRGEARFSVTLGGTFMIEIWIMKEYGVRSSCSKSIILCTDKLLTRYFLPICFTNNAEIIGIDDHTFLLKCHYSGDLLEHFGDSQNLSGCEAALYAESRLSFPNDHGEI